MADLYDALGAYQLVIDTFTNEPIFANHISLHPALKACFNLDTLSKNDLDTYLKNSGKFIHAFEADLGLRKTKHTSRGGLGSRYVRVPKSA